MGLARRGQVLIPAVMRLIALCAVSLLVSGCISLHSVRSEEESSSAPDLSRVCAYAWRTGEVLFRSDSPNTNWEAPNNFGYGTTLPHIEELATGCPRPHAERVANLSVYYLEHESKVYHYALGLPMAFLTGLTLGTFPVPVERYYFACVQATSSDGLNRFAIATGRSNSLQNLWGGVDGDTRRRLMRTEETERRAKLMKELTSQAWHKLWRLQAENSGAENCRQKLDAIVGRSAPPGRQTEAAPNIGSHPAGRKHVERPRNSLEAPSDNFVNCVANGERMWRYQSKCD
jgi:hypothetical protein